MRLTRVVFVLLACLVAPLVAQQPATPVATDRAAVDRAIAAVYPSLVRISVVMVDYQSGREVKGQAFGSGTIISADGYVVTNHHVAGRTKRIVCTLSDREEVPADLVGTDPLADIAVVKLRPATPRTFPFARFGDSSKLRPGDPVLALGSPLALSQSVTRGIVSNKDMIMSAMGGDMSLDGEDVGTIVKWIGHDAAIYPGNSGGPLVSLTGQIIGVNEISFGLAGAIPGNLAKAVAEALIKEGHVRRSWTGIAVQPRATGMAGPGALIGWVADKSPAAAAGVKSGDILVKVNDSAVDVNFAEQLPQVNQTLLGLPIGQPARLIVRRDGKDMPLSITTVERPPVISPPSEFKPWGFVGSDISAFEARDLGRDSNDGVRIINTRPGGPAEQAKPALGRNDVILEVDGQPVRTVADLEARTRATLGSKAKASVLVGFERGAERRLTVVEIGLPTQGDQGADASKAWVPVTVQVLTPTLADRLGLKGKTGVRVTRVIDSKSPLKLGDVILAIDGEPVRATAPTDEDVFQTSIRRYRIGSSVNLTVHRAGAEIAMPVVLGATPKLAREMNNYTDADFEFKARDMADADQDDPRLRGASKGVMVESVSQGGWAALARLGVGDLILAVDGRPVANVEELKARMSEIVAKRPASVLFQVRRGVRTLFVEIEPAWK